ncbi:GntP family permease [Phreatobacter sp.]|uniref:GntP family permease n=1 Tax=Phreatobacter sp. TaxID=1966341 RepID=UPI0025F6A990|nr:GntP family permease [Phreatobacter sp.]
MTGILVVLAALAALVILTYRGASLLLTAPALAVLAVLVAEGGPLLATFTQVFMPAAGRFIILYFPLFLLGAVFGKLMEVSGSANVLAESLRARFGARHAILAVVMSCALLTYGGVSLFVVAFAVWPIASVLFADARLPRVLIPATIALGAFTFTMTALPGTPAIQNAIPMPYFHTTAFAAPGLGIVASLIMLSLGWLWLERRARSLGPEPENAPAPRPDMEDAVARPTLLVSLLPLASVLALNAAFAFWLIPGLDATYLALPKYGSTDLAAVRGLWSIIAALVLSCLVLVAIHWRNLAETLTETLENGAADSLKPIFNTASLVGFGAVIASLAAFSGVRDGLLDLGGGSPLVSLALGTSLLAGLTGSASGGMSIALESLGHAYREMGLAAGVSPDLMHRVTSLATGSLDALPHNGAVVTLLTICGLTHREAYGDIAVVAVIVPTVALIAVIILGTVFGSF